MTTRLACERVYGERAWQAQGVTTTLSSHPEGYLRQPIKAYRPASLLAF
jgi:hypothetical protein